jgi:MOSC domain-containing protein YiiM
MSTLDLFVPPSAATNATIVSLHRSNGGVPKLEVHSARVTAQGMEGDRQRNLKHHGGPDRALCLYAIELIEALQSEGHPIEPGAMGENVVVRGVDWRSMVPGVRLRLGGAEIELTSYAHPCRNIAGAFRGGRSERVSSKLYPGWSRVYARVTREATLAPGDQILFL